MKKVFFLLCVSFFLTGCMHTEKLVKHTELKDLENVQVKVVGSDTKAPTVLPELKTIEGLEIKGTGAEPFWNFTAKGNELEWSHLGAEEDPVTMGFRISIEEVADGYRITNPTGFEAIMTKDPCTDGMSDIDYAYRAVVTRDDKTWNGCATITL